MMKLFSKETCDKNGREYYFDNAKFILIFFVVLAHLCSPLKAEHGTMSALWIVINNLHMPCLIFISGYFAKSYIKADGSVKIQRPFTYLIYYAAAQLAVSLFEYYVLGYTEISKSFFNARSSLWYLQCLIIWFILLPYITKFNKKFVMIAAIIIGLFIGYDSKAGTFLSVMRLFAHFPFFLAGYYFKKEWLYKFRNKITQAAAVLVFVIMILLAYYFREEIPLQVLESKYNYWQLNLDISFGLAWVSKAIFYVIAVILCCAFLLLVPRQKTFFTTLGKRTLQVYILHRFIYLAELEYKWWLPFNSPSGCVKMVIIALLVTLILSLKPFEYPFKLLGKIKIDKLLEKKEG